MIEANNAEKGKKGGKSPFVKAMGICAVTFVICAILVGMAAWKNLGWLGIPSLIFGFISFVSAVCVGILWIVGKIRKKVAENAAKNQDIPQEGKQAPNVPPPVEHGNLVLSDDPWRKHVDNRFEHVENLIVNLHEQQNAGRVRDAVRISESLNFTRDIFQETSATSFRYLIIGIMASAITSFVVSIVVLQFGKDIVDFLFKK